MKETMLLMEAWDGSLVQVPESKAEQFRKAQEEAKARNGQPTEEQKKFAEILKRRILGE